MNKLIMCVLVAITVVGVFGQEWDPTWTQDRKIQWLENHQDQQDTILNQDVELRNEFFRRHPERADENHRNNQQNNQQNSQWNNQRNDDHHDDRRG